MYQDLAISTRQLGKFHHAGVINSPNNIVIISDLPAILELKPDSTSLRQSHNLSIYSILFEVAGCF